MGSLLSLLSHSRSPPSNSHAYFMICLQSTQVYYEPGQEYNPHHDWWVVNGNGPKSRFCTFLLYLNDKAAPDAGGDTTFPKCQDKPGLGIHPGKGGAGFFYNLLPDGNPDEYSLHAATPVQIGEKWFANVWLWDPTVGGR